MDSPSDFQMRESDPCAICGAPSTDWDHDHPSDLIRGRLCWRCNRGLGFFKDDPELLRVAALYAERPLSSLQYSVIRRARKILSDRKSYADPVRGARIREHNRRRRADPVIGATINASQREHYYRRRAALKVSE
jgi:hypothetical protein